MDGDLAENSAEFGEDQSVSAGKDKFSLEEILLSKIISFFRQVLCCGLSGLFLAPYVTAVADLERINADDVHKLFKYFGSYDKERLRFWEFQISGSLLAAVFTFGIGRRYSVILSNLLLLIAVLVLSYREKYAFLKSDEVNIHYGMGLVLASYEFQRVVFVIYAAEVTHSLYRGFFIGFFLVSYTYGKHSTYLIGKTSKYSDWSTLNAYLAIGNFVASLLVPETPFWLVQRGKREKAIARFQWIRAGSFDDDELEIMLDKAEVAAVRRTSVLAMRDSVISRDFAFCLLLTVCTILTIKNLWPLMIAWLDTRTIQSSAFNPFLSIVALKEMYKKYNLNHVNTMYRTYLPFFGALIFLFSNFLIWRKVLFLGSIILQSIFFFGHSMTYNIRFGDVNYMARFGYLCYMYAYIGAIPVTMILPVEIFPAVTREIGVGINNFMDCSSETINSIIVFYNEFGPIHILHSLRPSIWTQLIAVFEVVLLPLSFMFILFFMPETNGLTLEEAAEAAEALNLMADEYNVSSEENHVVEESTD